MTRIKQVIKPALSLLLAWILSTSAFAEGEKKVETLSEVSVIGSSELPNVNFDLPWQLPTIGKRDDHSPPKSIPGVLEYIEPKRYRQQLYFSRHLEVEAPVFIVR